VAQWLYKLNSA